MAALQILHTLCTLPLEKMNTILLACLYLSFTLCTHSPQHPRAHPLISATNSCSMIRFYIINCISFKPNSQFLTSVIRWYSLCSSNDVLFFVFFLWKVTLHNITSKREIIIIFKKNHPNAAVHRFQQTYKHKRLILSYLVHQAGYASQIGGNYATSCQLEGITAMKTRQI